MWICMPCCQSLGRAAAHPSQVLAVVLAYLCIGGSGARSCANIAAICSPNTFEAADNYQAVHPCRQAVAGTEQGCTCRACCSNDRAVSASAGGCGSRRCLHIPSLAPQWVSCSLKRLGQDCRVWLQYI